MTQHLGAQVSAYVDRRLDAQTLHAFDRHLVACLGCRYAADEERRILTSLRSGPTPGVPADLHTMLLALANGSGAAAGRVGAAGHAGAGLRSRTSPSGRLHSFVDVAGNGNGGPLRRVGPFARLGQGGQVDAADAVAASSEVNGPWASADVPPIPPAPVAVRQMRLPTVAPAAPALHRSPRRAAMVAGLAAGASAAAAIGLAFVGPGPGSASPLRPATRAPGTATVTAIPAAFTGTGLTSSPLGHALERPGR